MILLLTDATVILAYVFQKKKPRLKHRSRKCIPFRECSNAVGFGGAVEI
jgi:hypothetical protein